MPTREETVADAIALFEHAEYPTGLSLSTAWLGIYQTLLWFEPVNDLGFTALPHIIDADKLRPASPVRRRRRTTPSSWQQRASAISACLAQELCCAPDALPAKSDLLMNQPSYRGMQRQNTLGIAFAGLTRHILEKFGHSSVAYTSEVEASAIFPGISFPGRSSIPRIDLLASRGAVPRAIISAKWSVRHDRLNDITNECPVYKAAYQRIDRQSGHPHLAYYVVTNEFDSSRLRKMLDDTCVDGVVHVHKAAVTEVCGLNGRLNRLMDMVGFVQSTAQW